MGCPDMCTCVLDKLSLARNSERWFRYVSECLVFPLYGLGLGPVTYLPLLWI